MGPTKALATAAVDRLRTAFRPATLQSYTRMFKDLLAFLQLAGLALSQVNTTILLAYMEFLHSSGMRHSNIANNMAGIRAMFIVYGLPTAPFVNERIALFLKATKINATFQPKLVSMVSIDMLIRICDTCNALRDPLMFKALYLFAFFFLSKNVK